MSTPEKNSGNDDTATLSESCAIDKNENEDSRIMAPGTPSGDEKRDLEKNNIEKSGAVASEKLPQASETQDGGLLGWLAVIGR